VAPKVAVRVVVQVGAFADSARAQEVRPPKLHLRWCSKRHGSLKTSIVSSK